MTATSTWIPDSITPTADPSSEPTFEATATFAPTASPLVADNESIREAVKLWLDHRDDAILKYGHISTWDTRLVTDMSGLFSLGSSFNDDISGWNVAPSQICRQCCATQRNSTRT